MAPRGPRASRSYLARPATSHARAEPKSTTHSPSQRSRSPRGRLLRQGSAVAFHCSSRFQNVGREGRLPLYTRTRLEREKRLPLPGRARSNALTSVAQIVRVGTNVRSTPAAGFTRGEQASWGAPGSTATASHHQQETTCQRATEKASRRGLLSPQRGGSRRLNEGSRRIGAIALPSKTGLGGLFSERPQFREHPPPLGHPAPFLRRPRSLGASSRTVMGRAAHLRTGGVKTGRKTKRSAKPRSSSSTGSRASGSSVGWSDGSPRVGRKPPARSLDRPASRKHTRRVAPRVRCLRRAWR